MKAIEIKLSVDAIAPVLDLMREVSGELKTETSLSSEIVHNSSKGLCDFWRNELLAAQTDDCRKFLSLFGGDFFADGRVRITPKESDSILRACSAMRLRLRATRLEKMTEDELQNRARENPLDVELPHGRPVIAYTLLAEIQTIILRHLNPFDDNPGN